MFLSINNEAEQISKLSK